MKRIWDRWVAYTSREEDSLPLAMVRVFAPLVIVMDLLQGARLGLIPLLWRDYDHGGLSRFTGSNALIDNIDPYMGGPVTVWISIGSLLMASLGVATRPMLLVGLLAYSQIGHLYPPGDRAIDRLLRTVFLILLFSGSHQRLSLMRWLRKIPTVKTIAAWPGDLIRFILILVYLSAGLHKLGSSAPGWLLPTKTPELYKILTDPMAGTLNATFWQDYFWIFRPFGWGTILLELTPLLILTRWGPWWACFGLLMHLGIAATMTLGAFSWGMLSLYPLLFAPWIIRAGQR